MNSSYVNFSHFIQNTFDMFNYRHWFPEVYKIKEESKDFQEFYYELNKAITNYVNTYYNKIVTMYSHIPGVSDSDTFKIFTMYLTMERFHFKGFRSELKIREKFEKKNWVVTESDFYDDVKGIDLFIEKEEVKFTIQVKTSTWEKEKQVDIYTKKGIDILAFANVNKIVLLSDRAKEYFKG